MLLQVSNETDGVLNFTVQPHFPAQILQFTNHQLKVLSLLHLPIWNTRTLQCWEHSFGKVGNFGKFNPSYLPPSKCFQWAQLCTSKSTADKKWESTEELPYPRDQRGDPDTFTSMKDLIGLSHPLPQWTPLISVVSPDISFSAHLVYSAVPSEVSPRGRDRIGWVSLQDAPVPSPTTPGTTE